MPHYKDGQEAKVGDFARGTTYNAKGEKAGTIVSITPGTDSCNCQLAFLEEVTLNEVWDNSGTLIVRAQPDGSKKLFRLAIDYTEVKALEKIGGGAR